MWLWTLLNGNGQSKLTKIGVYVMESLVGHIKNMSVLRNRLTVQAVCSFTFQGQGLRDLCFRRIKMQPGRTSLPVKEKIFWRK